MRNLAALCIDLSEERKIVGMNKYGERYEIKEPAMKRSSVVKGLIIVVIVISAVTISSAFVISQFWDQLSSDTVTTITSPTDNSESGAIMPSPIDDNAIIMERNDFQPEGCNSLIE
jgi:uncharacterized membrane protein